MEKMTKHFAGLAIKNSVSNLNSNPSSILQIGTPELAADTASAPATPATLGAAGLGWARGGGGAAA